MFFEIRNTFKGDSSRLFTPIQNYSDGKCLFFWYHQPNSAGLYFRLNKIKLSYF
jgi:hypothetical protein